MCAGMGVCWGNRWIAGQRRCRNARLCNAPLHSLTHADTDTLRHKQTQHHLTFPPPTHLLHTHAHTHTPLTTPTQGVLASGGEDNLVAVWSLDRAPQQTAAAAAGAATTSSRAAAAAAHGSNRAGGSGGAAGGSSSSSREPPPELMFKHVGHKGGVSCCKLCWTPGVCLRVRMRHCPEVVAPVALCTTC